MSNDNKTLADVQPGGRVRLGDQAERARFEAWAHAQSYRGGNIMADRDSVHQDVYADPIAQLTWKSWQAALSAHPQYITDAYELGMRDGQALSAQPSPGGQDALATLSARWRACADQHDENAREADSIGDMTATVQYLETNAEALRQAASELDAALAARQPVGQGDARAQFEAWAESAGWYAVAHRADREAPYALNAVEFAWQAFQAALAARQPVGEPVVKSVGIDALAKLLEDEAAECEKAWVERADTYMSGRASGFLLAADHFRKIATSQRWSEFLSSPAQAVDLGQFRPAVCAMALYAEEPEDVDEAKRLLALIDSQAGGK